MYTIPARPTSAQSSSAPLLPRHSKAAFFLVTGLFFLWAIPNNLNDVLIRQFMKSFEINRLEAGLVQSAFYFGYFLLAIPAALVFSIIVPPLCYVVVAGFAYRGVHLVPLSKPSPAATQRGSK